MKTQLSTWAQVAKLCRQYMKANGIKGKASSETYSGGTSVRVYVQDQTPEAKAQLESEFAKYEYGHFDGMTDCYEYNNQRDDIPQVKFLFVENACSAELKQKIWTFIREHYDTGSLSDTYSEINYSPMVEGVFVQDLVYQIFAGGHCLSESFWNEQ